MAALSSTEPAVHSVVAVDGSSSAENAEIAVDDDKNNCDEVAPSSSSSSSAADDGSDGDGVAAEREQERERERELAAMRSFYGEEKHLLIVTYALSL